MIKPDREPIYPLQIRTQKASTSSRVIGVIFAVLYGGYLIYDPSHFGNFGPDNKFTYYVGCFLLVVSVFGLFDIYRVHGKEARSLWMYKDRFEYESGFIFYKVYFSRIQSINIFMFGGDTPLLLINVKDKSEVIRAQRFLATRIYLWIGHLFYETPVILDANNFEIRSDALKETLEMHWKNQPQSPF